MKRLYDKALMDQIAKVYGNEVSFLSEFSRALLDIIREGLIRDGQVRLHQFGTFKLKWMNTRNGVNPSTGEKIIIQGRPRVIFSPAKGLKNSIEPNPAALIPFEEIENLTSNSAKVVSKDEPVESANQSDELESAQTVSVKSIAANITVDESELSEPELSDSDKEAAVANIQDEIEVLEQVADILKSKDLVSEQDSLDGSELNDIETAQDEALNDISFETDSFEAEDLNLETGLEFSQASNIDKPEELGVVSTDNATSSERVEKSVVEDIKELSDLQYFKKTSEYHESTSAIESSVKENLTEAESYEEKLDYDLDVALSDTNEDEDEDEVKSEDSKPWFAIAAAIFVLLAAGVLFNALRSDDPSDEQQYAESETPVIAQIETENDVSTVESIEEVNVAESEISVNSGDVITESESTELEIIETVSEEVEDESIIVTSEKYDELKRVSAEQDVFFSAVDHKLTNGDSLWRLAKKHYVNPFYWPHIYQANQNTITNPDRVKIGRIVTLPTLYGEPDALTQQDKHNVAMGYYLNYLYHKAKGNPYAYFSLIGVEKFDPDLLIQYRQEIERSDVDNLALLAE